MGDDELSSMFHIVMAFVAAPFNVNADDGDEAIMVLFQPYPGSLQGDLGGGCFGIVLAPSTARALAEELLSQLASMKEWESIQQTLGRGEPDG